MAQGRSEEFKTPPCRLSFARDLFTARAQEAGKKPKYGATLIFEKSSGARATLEKHLVAAAKAEWGEKAIDMIKNKVIRSPFLEGDAPEARNKDTGELHPGMGSDVFFIRPSANEDRPPVIRYKSETVPATPQEVYSGCYGFAVLNAFAWTNDKGGKGVSFGILYFQKTQDGEPLAAGGGPLDTKKYFEKIEDTGDAPAETKSGDGAGGLFG